MTWTLLRLKSPQTGLPVQRLIHESNKDPWVPFVRGGFPCQRPVMRSGFTCRHYRASSCPSQRASNAESVSLSWRHHGPLTRYVKLRVAHALGMPGTFSPPPQVSDLDMIHGTCVTHVPWCMPGSLTNGFGGGENVPGIPGACATRNFAYLVRGPCLVADLLHAYGPSHPALHLPGPRALQPPLPVLDSHGGETGHIIHIAKTIRSISIRHWSDRKVSGRYLFNVDSGVIAVWDVAFS